MQWNTEFGRAQYYMAQANALLARAKQDLTGLDEIVAEMASLSGSLKMEGHKPHDGYIPEDGRTALHQTSLALENVRGSLIADGKIKEGNVANEIRGKIMSWFDGNDE